jgi:hypothetical protein
MGTLGPAAELASTFCGEKIAEVHQAQGPPEASRVCRQHRLKSPSDSGAPPALKRDGQRILATFEAPEALIDDDAQRVTWCPEGAAPEQLIAQPRSIVRTYQRPGTAPERKHDRRQAHGSDDIPTSPPMQVSPLARHKGL